MRKLPFILFLFCSIVFSQKNDLKIDSLKNELSQATDAKDKLYLYRLVVNEFEKSQVNYDSAFYYANKAYDFSVKENLPKQQVNFLFKIAMIYYRVENYDKSLNFYSSALSLSENINYKKLIPSITNNIGDIYMLKHEYPKAKDLFNKCLEYAIEEKNTKLEALEYINIGEVYYHTKQFDKSLEYINKGIKKYETVGASYTSNLYILSNTLIALEKQEEAKQVSLKGLDKAQSRNNSEFIYKHSLLLSNIYSETNNYKESLFYSSKALQYKDSIDKKSEFDKLEKLQLNFKIKEQAATLKNINQKNTFLRTIYLLVVIGVILIVILIFRQRKIMRMTKTIHDIQFSLIKYELDLKKEKEGKKKKLDKTIFNAVQEGDNELKEQSP